MRVLVTGGAGFIGSHVADQLLAGGHEVTILDNLSSGRRENVPSGARLFVTDLRDREATAGVLAEVRPQAVCHQAAQASVAVSMREPILDAEVNVLGGLHLVEACLAVDVERVVFASTGGAIYGEVPIGTRADESTPPAPESPYAIHKLTLELLLAMYRRHRGLDARILRYANVYGPRQDPHGEAGVIAIFLDAARAGRTLFVNARKAPGDGGCVRDYVYVKDVARMNVLALTGVVSENVANVGTGVPTTTLELAQTILNVTKSGSKIEDRPSREGDLGVSLLEPRLPERYLGTLVGLAEGLDETRASLG